LSAPNSKKNKAGQKQKGCNAGRKVRKISGDRKFAG
jgi:hypothetical protein